MDQPTSKEIAEAQAYFKQRIDRLMHIPDDEVSEAETEAKIANVAIPKDEIMQGVDDMIYEVKSDFGKDENGNVIISVTKSRSTKLGREILDAYTGSKSKER
ncbi:MAG: hypothetical protein WCP03_01235 [Candidatus Saccharibacteria bacterium]